MKKLTPILYVDAIEPCLPFWVNRLGFAKTVEVPEGDKLGFVILAKDGIEGADMIHHRAQLGVYLRLLDVPVPAIYGPTADQPGGF